MRTCTCMQCPLTLVLAHTLMVPNGRIVTFCVVWTGPLTSLSWNFHTSTESLFWEELVAPFVILLLSELLQEELQWPQHDYPKVSLSTCCGSLCKLPHSHQAQSFVNYLSAHHNWNCLGVGHGGDIQQQHVLIVVSYSLEFGGLPPQIWGMGWLHCPIPSSSNNWPKGCICRVSSLQNWAHMLNTWVPESIKAVTSHPPIITGASLEHPTRCAMGSGLRNGIGATCCCPFLLAASIRVSFGSGSGRECCEFIDCSWQGVWLHSLSSPILV